MLMSSLLLQILWIFALLQLELEISLVDEATSLLFKHSHCLNFHIANFCVLRVLRCLDLVVNVDVEISSLFYVQLSFFRG